MSLPTRVKSGPKRMLEICRLIDKEGLSHEAAGREVDMRQSNTTVEYNTGKSLGLEFLRDCEPSVQETQLEALAEKQNREEIKEFIAKAIKSHRDNPIIQASKSAIKRLLDSLPKPKAPRTGRLQGKVALVAGGGKNLGSLISKRLAAAGASVVVHYNSASSKASAEATVTDIERNGGEAFAIQGNFTNVRKIGKVFRAAKVRFGGIDIAINTVGKVLKKSIAHVTEDEFDEMSAVNSKAAFFFIKEAGKHLRDGGKICSVVTSLLAAYTGQYSTYAGSKASVEHFTRAASKEFASKKISVTAVGPGPMDTPFFHDRETPEDVLDLKQAAALGRLTKITDIVPLIMFLVTEGEWMTGQTIFANGGFTTR